MLIKEARLHLILGVTVGTLMLLGGCSKHKDKEKMELNELKQHALNAVDKKSYAEATDSLEKIITKYADHQDINKFKLVLADTYFKTGNYAAAGAMFQHFVQYYPSDTKAEYAHYKAVLSKFYETLRTDCDQSATQDAIALCDGYMRPESNKKYRKDVIDIKNTCENKLLNKEIYVFNFYLKEGKYDAAHNRLAYIKHTFLTQKPSIEPRLLYLECKLAQKQKKTDAVEKNIQALFEKFPHSHYTQMAQSLNKQPQNFLF
jgi:outer membrane assembly lipoprotein YfiO